MNDPYPTQLQMVDFVLGRTYVQGQLGAALLAGMGSGKTRAILEAISRLKDMNECKRAVVIAPKLVVESVWPAEVAKWGYDFTIGRVNGSVPKLRGINLLLCTPDSVHHLLNDAVKFDFLTVDESTKFKNWTAKRTKSLRKLLPFFNRRVIATGTFMPNGVQDVFSQTFIVDDGAALGKNITIFRTQYMTKGGWQGRQFVPKNGAEQNILDAIAPLCIRVDTKDCAEMPDLNVIDVPLDMPARALLTQKTLKKQLIAELENGDTLIAPNAASAYMKCRQLASGFLYHEEGVESFHTVKLDATMELVEGIGNEQVVIFYNFKEDLLRLQSRFGDDVTSLVHNNGLKRWLDGKVQILACQEMSGAHGLNLQKNCRYMIFYNMSDSAERYDQMICRVYRPGGHNKVFAYRLIAKESLDEVIVKRVENKLSNQRDFLEALKSWAIAI